MNDTRAFPTDSVNGYPIPLSYFLIPMGVTEHAYSKRGQSFAREGFRMFYPPPRRPRG